MRMAACSRALLLMGVLLAAFLLLSSLTIDAAEEQKTGDAFTYGTVADEKQADAVCSRCCKYVKHRSILRCIRCCSDEEEAPANDADSIVDNKQTCPCCLRVVIRGSPRCISYCCPDGNEIPVKAEETKENKN